jgi:hypothetical protein
MLTPFRSALSASKVPLSILLLFAWVLALLVSGSFSSSHARMDEPIPAPHFEGWPDPEHSSRPPQSESKIADVDSADRLDHDLVTNAKDEFSCFGGLLGRLLQIVSQVLS